MATNSSTGWVPNLGSRDVHQLTHTLSRRSQHQDEEIDAVSVRSSEPRTPASEDGNKKKENYFDSGDTSGVSLPKDGKSWDIVSEVNRAKDYMIQDEVPDGAIGLTWKDLTVKARSVDASIHENAISQYNIPKLISEARRPAPLKTILDKTHGSVQPGQMLLVLGRPGSGCTTLLKMLANRRAGYKEVSGDVRYGSMDAKEAAHYRGQIVMNTEEEVFFPTLTVGQTIDFATRMKTSHIKPSAFKTVEDFRLAMKDFLLKSVNIEHTVDTKVGDAYVRGVSGGERKRVSIIETLASRGSIFCWDNSTRGLDASTALEYVKSVKILTSTLQITTVMTLYQAGNGIYELFDKVLVLDEGQEIYYGPRSRARPFMEELGFVCMEGSNVADFLTGVTVPTERAIKPGMESQFPRNAKEIREAYQRSDIFASSQTELDYPSLPETERKTELFRQAVARERHPSLPKSSVLMASLWYQTYACILRQYQILWGDKSTFMVKQVSTLVQALIAGSLFYQATASSPGLFIKGGAIFFAVLYNALMAMSEVTDSFAGRPVLAKHRGFAFYHPAAFCFAQVTADIPVIFFQVSIFSIIVYFMVGLESTAGGFFTFWIIVFAATICMTALFRLCGAAFSTFDGASKVSGLLIMALIMYTGYLISKPQIHPWFVWIYWIDPMAYAFSAMLSNEFHGKEIPCAGPNLIPLGPDYQMGAPYQACAGVGGQKLNSTVVNGDDYLKSLSYSHSTIWRNFGIIWVWWALFVGLTIFFTCRWSMVDRGGYLLIPREKAKKQSLQASQQDVESQEKQSNGRSTAADPNKSAGDAANQLIRNTSVFTWKNLSYTVSTKGGDRKLLDNVQGWVKPGMLGALMGASGAGKTTLLDVLARRKTEGTITGSIQVDGRPLPVSFQRSAGYCEQLDVHEAYSTVREALEFSALLRQSRDVPVEEKLRYVDTIVDLLEMHDIQDTLIGRPGAGLTVEQRKRLTIGVELVAKPNLLIFLDEPTSGLDGQAAFNIVRCLRKLADAGQAVLVTIHQPSAQLFAQFDTLLLLAKGGQTAYFGDIGDNGAAIKEYFGRYGVPCPQEANPAEWMIDICSGHLSQGKNWADVWLSSPEYQKVTREVNEIIEDAASRPPNTQDDGHEFATTYWYQTKQVTWRMSINLFRNTEYVNNKLALHVFAALFNGFTFWMIGDSVNDMQLTLFTIFQFIFVAPGVIAQLQPLFIDRRDLYEVRERKSKMYHWTPFVSGLIVSEVPYLIICAVLYFVCWYYTAGLPSESSKAGGNFFVMLIYEFVYTGMGQAIAAYAPNAVFASLTNPLILGILVMFAGVLVPYSQITAFWRYWIYYFNPFNYLMGSMLTFSLFDKEVNCKESELAIFNPFGNQTCGEYLSTYLAGPGYGANLLNPSATADCRVCQYTRGSDYLRTLNLNDYYYAWRDTGITVAFALGSYALVYVLMKLRTKKTKTAS